MQTGKFGAIKNRQEAVMIELAATLFVGYCLIWLLTVLADMGRVLYLLVRAMFETRT